MRTASRVAGVLAAGAAALLMSAPPAVAAPAKFTFSTSGVTADAFFTNSPVDGNLVRGVVYTDVFVAAGDQATKADGTRYAGDFAFVQVYSYKIDRRGNHVPVASKFGEAGDAAVDFTGDARRLTSATLTARLPMQTCDERWTCTSAGTSEISVAWTGTGATTTYKGSYRTTDPGQFTSKGRYSGTYRLASASGTVPVLGRSSATFGSISSGTSSDRTICHAC